MQHLTADFFQNYNKRFAGCGIYKHIIFPASGLNSFRGGEIIFQDERLIRYSF
jgi:hypothetical protein